MISFFSHFKSHSPIFSSIGWILIDQMHGGEEAQACHQFPRCMHMITMEWNKGHFLQSVKWKWGGCVQGLPISIPKSICKRKWEWQLKGNNWFINELTHTPTHMHCKHLFSIWNLMTQPFSHLVYPIT